MIGQETEDVDLNVWEEELGWSGCEDV